MFTKFTQCICVILTLWIVNNGFVFHHVHKNYLNNNGSEDLSVYFDITDEDYEMISEHELDKLKMHFEDDELVEFNKIAEKEYKDDIQLRCSATEVESKKSESKNTDMEIDNSDVTTVLATFLPVRKAKREVLKTTVKKQGTNTDAKTDSDSLSDGIYHAVNTGKHKTGFRIVDSIKEIISFNMVTNCTADDAGGIGLRAVKCLIRDFKENRQAYNILAFRLWSIAVIWLCVYLVVAIPLWCARGWCCCCLCCKFFKPQETIQEAKKYLLLNPPGTLVTKRGGIIHYEPTEREKDCYEEFAHFIRTL